MSTLVDYTARFLNTAEAMDYTPDELDDLTSRKVEAVEFDGDALARTVRARRGTARYLDQADPYDQVGNIANVTVWDGTRQGTPHTDGNRRMVAAGRTVTFPVRQLDVRHESRVGGLGATLWSLITRK